MSTHKTLVFHPSGENLSISVMQDWVIIVPDDATAAECYTAEEFQKWFSQATGLTLALKAQREDPNRGYIVISGSVALGGEDIEGERSSEKRQTLIGEYIVLCERYNMSHAAETQAAEAYFEELRNQ